MTKAAQHAAEPRARACAGEPIAFMVTGVRVPPGAEDRRTPIAIVEGAIGPLRLSVTVSSLQGNKLVIRPPQAGDGSPAIEMPQALADDVARAVVEAVRADAVASSVLLRQGRPPMPDA